MSAGNASRSSEGAGTLKPVRKTIFITAALSALLLTGCASPAPTADETATAAPSTPAPEVEVPVSSIDDALELSGCEELIENTPEPPAVASTTCKLTDDSDLAFLWEFRDEQAALDWLESGELEIGPSDVVYTAGPVVMLTQDAKTAQAFSEFATPFN